MATNPKPDKARGPVRVVSSLGKKKKKKAKKKTLSQYDKDRKAQRKGVMKKAVADKRVTPKKKVVSRKKIRKEQHVRDSTNMAKGRPTRYAYKKTK